MALSTWLPLDKLIKRETVKTPPILLCHGDEDDMVGLDRAEKCAKTLSELTKDFTFKVYPGLGHTIANEDELNDIRAFLDKILAQGDIKQSKL